MSRASRSFTIILGRRGNLVMHIMRRRFPTPLHRSCNQSSELSGTWLRMCLGLIGFCPSSSLDSRHPCFISHPDFTLPSSQINASPLCPRHSTSSPVCLTVRDHPESLLPFANNHLNSLNILPLGSANHNRFKTTVPHTNI